jgi:hypothetical protein
MPIIPPTPENHMTAPQRFGAKLFEVDAIREHCPWRSSSPHSAGDLWLTSAVSGRSLKVTAGTTRQRSRPTATTWEE